MTRHAVHREIREGIDRIDRFQRRTEAVETAADAVGSAPRVHLLGCGSSYWTALLARYACAEAGVDGSAFQSAEYRRAGVSLNGREVVVAYSQSGETTETVTAVRHARREGAYVIAISNTRGSTLDDLADTTVVTPAGTEQAVLATKSVDAALVATLELCGVDAAAVGADRLKRGCRAALDLDYEPAVDLIADARSLYALGQGTGYALAGEAATKLGEGALVHATPLPAPEIRHGPIANASGEPVLLLADDPSRTGLYGELLGRLREAGAPSVVVRHPDVDCGGDAVLTLPEEAPEHPLVTLKAIQTLTYETAVRRGFDPDDPPELSKHVEWSAIG